MTHLPSIVSRLEWEKKRISEKLKYEGYREGISIGMAQ